VTGDEPWTAAQRPYLAKLAREAGTKPPAELAPLSAVL